MKSYLNELALFVGRLNRRHIQFFLVILYIVLFVLGAGAPGADSDIGM
jgi:hypothetical protein